MPPASERRRLGTFPLREKWEPCCSREIPGTNPCLPVCFSFRDKIRLRSGRHPEGPRFLQRAEGSRAQSFALTYNLPPFLSAVTGPSRFFCLISSSGPDKIFQGDVSYLRMAGNSPLFDNLNPGGRRSSLSQDGNAISSYRAPKSLFQNILRISPYSSKILRVVWL
jgi:hypothetical protein